MTTPLSVCQDSIGRNVSHNAWNDIGTALSITILRADPEPCGVSTCSVLRDCWRRNQRFRFLPFRNVYSRVSPPLTNSDPQEYLTAGKSCSALEPCKFLRMSLYVYVHLRVDWWVGEWVCWWSNVCLRICMQYIQGAIIAYLTISLKRSLVILTKTTKSWFRIVCNRTEIRIQNAQWADRRKGKEREIERERDEKWHWKLGNCNWTVWVSKSHQFVGGPSITQETGQGSCNW
jgi:hypothetical protein